MNSVNKPLAGNSVFIAVRL